MPGFVKTPRDEKKWSRAKQAAETSLARKKRPGSNKYALANYIFHRMRKAQPIEKHVVNGYRVYRVGKTGRRLTCQTHADMAEARDHMAKLKKLYGEGVKVGIDFVQVVPSVFTKSLDPHGSRLAKAIDRARELLECP